MSNLRFIIENTLVPHTAFEQAQERIEQCLEYASHAVEPVCFALLGESRTGKSRVLAECYEAHAPQRTKEGLQMPIVRVTTPSKPTVKGLVEVLLSALRDPSFGRGSEIEKTVRLRTQVEECGTKMILIDEFQHFYDKVTHRVTEDVADWLKVFVDEAKIALVVAGLPSCTTVLRANEQLEGRFLAPLQMPHFDWSVDAEREEFVGILEGFHEELAKHFDLPNLANDEMAFRCYCATGGLMGYLTKCLRQMVWNALDAKTTRITLEDLLTAHQIAVWAKAAPAGMQQPFSKKFLFAPTADLLARVRQIGVAVAPPPKTRRAAPAAESPEPKQRRGRGRPRAESAGSSAF